MSRKIRLYLQKDAMGCGIACLQMICGYYGRKYSTRHISQFCHATAEGVSLLAISDGAEKLGLKTTCGRTDADGLRQIDSPCILHWCQNHFVVLYKVKDETFYIADPAKGMAKYGRDEFERQWASTQSGGHLLGIAMFLEPLPDFYAKNETAASESRSLRFLWAYIKQYRQYFFQIFLGLLVGSVLQLILPFLTQGIVDLGISHKDIGLVWLILCGELVIVTGRTLSDFIRRWILLHISMRINISLVSDFLIKLLRLPMHFFDTKLMGDLLQRMGDHNRVQGFLTSQVLGVMFSLLSLVVFGFVLLLYNRPIFCIFIAGSALYGLWITRFLSMRKVLDYELFELQAIAQNRTFQFLTSIQEIKLQDCGRRRRWEWEDTQADLFGMQTKILRLQQSQEAGSIFINELKNLTVTAFAATAVINGEITLGAMLAIQYIVGSLNSPIDSLMNFIYSLQDTKISLERINEIHQVSDEDCRPNLLSEFSGSHDIALRDVSFRYDPHALTKTLDSVSLRIPAGKVTAIVGASGSGKTTLVKLMLGYYPTENGTISVAGHDLNEYQKKWWRNRCGVVMQDGVIFSESIARNIANIDEEINTLRLEQAARIACIHDYVMSLPLKYNTLIGRDGVGLSQGQRQRILIARAVYKNPDFIFLDEATNSLDTKNEREIVGNLSQFYEGRTVVVVAHRLSTVKNADQIIVIDKGRVAETGTHQELVAKNGTYYQLVSSQLELGL